MIRDTDGDVFDILSRESQQGNDADSNQNASNPTGENERAQIRRNLNAMGTAIRSESGILLNNIQRQGLIEQAI